MGTDDNGYELAVCHQLGKAAKLRTGSRFSTDSPQFWGYLCLDFEDTYARYCVRLVQRLGRTVIDGIRPRKLGAHWT